MPGSRYHTLVVGAGPAGVMAALHAATAGPVLLVDSSPFPRDKSCGGMLNEYSQHFLSGFAELPESMMLEPRWVHFRYVDWDRGIRKATSLRFLNVDRRAFDTWLLTLLPTGVEVLPETSLEALSQDERGCHAVLRSRREIVNVTCDCVVGADGARSKVRRELGIPDTGRYVTLQDHVTLTDDLEAYFDCVYMREVGDHYAYSYVVPKGDTAIVGSVYYPGTRRPHEKQDQALAALRVALPQLGATVRREASVALSVRSPADVVPGSGSVLLAGEAAGFMSPTSGEGISYALNTGRLAGEAIGRNLGGDALEDYTRATARIARNIGRKLKWLPFMESPTGKYLAGWVPAPIVSRVTQGL